MTRCDELRRSLLHPVARERTRQWSPQRAGKELFYRDALLRCPTLRMSHEGERATDARMRRQPDRAPPHWLNPLVGQIHMIPEPRIELITPISNQPPKRTATAPAMSANQSSGRADFLLSPGQGPEQPPGWRTCRGKRVKPTSTVMASKTTRPWCGYSDTTRACQQTWHPRRRAARYRGRLVRCGGVLECAYRPTTSLSHSRRGAKLRRSQGAANLPTTAENRRVGGCWLEGAG